MQPNLQEQMLLNGQVDFSAVFTVTSYVNLIGMKVDPNKDIRWIFFADHGVDLYSNGIMVSQKLLKEKPKAVAGLVRALNRAIIETAGATDAAIASMMKIEPLMNATLEKQRLVYAFKTHFVTPETAEIGVGDIKEERMAKAIKLLAETSARARRCSDGRKRLRPLISAAEGRTRGQLMPAQRTRLVALLGKAEASHDGRLRGHRHTMLDNSDIASTRHARAFVCGALAGLVGHAELYVSGGAEHQGPDGAGRLR